MKKLPKFKRDYWTKPAGKFKALGHPARLWIAMQLLEGDRRVQEFVDASGLDFSTVSQHLAVMTREGAICAQKKGKFVYYSLCCQCVRDFLECMAKRRASKICRRSESD